MIPDLETALAAMDVLNRWVRKEHASRPRKAIYWLKANYAVRDAILAGLLTRFRFVQSEVACNRCRAGIYYDWDGQDRGRCHACNGTSRVTLKFVETTIADRFTWHSPLEYSSWLGWDVADLPPEDPGDWSPRRDGIDLPIEDAARLLNLVETHWSHVIVKRAPYDLGREEWDDTRYYRFAYHLDLEAATTGGCALCGGEAKNGDAGAMIHCHSRRPGLNLRSLVCHACQQKHPGGELWKVLGELPLPPHGPHLAAWIARHDHWFAIMFNHENRRRVELPA